MVMKNHLLLLKKEQTSAFANKVPGKILHPKGINYACNSGSCIMINYVIYMNHLGKL